jgi:HK97 family phage major capsid protein
MKFTKDANGNLVLTEEQFTAALEEQAQKAVDQLKKDLKLDTVQDPPIPAKIPGDGDDPADKYRPKANESAGEKHARLKAAVLDVRGGTLAVEKAPKEIKTIRFFRAQQLGDEVTVKALSEGSAADGGNLVPTEFSTDLKVAMENYGAINDCDYHELTANELDLRSVTTKPLIYQVDEGAQITEAASKFGKPQLIAKAFAGIQVMSKEVFQDNNVGLYDKLIALFVEGLNARKSKELFVGQSFTGIFGSTTPQITPMSSTNFDDVLYKELVAVATSLSDGQLAGPGGTPKWYMHRTTFGKIGSMVDDQGRPIIVNPWDAKSRMLLGFPVVLDEQITAATGAAQAATPLIAFGNLKWVDYGMRQEITSQVLTEGTVNNINLAEKRSLGLVIDTRWGIVVSIPGNIAILKTKAA